MNRFDPIHDHGSDLLGRKRFACQLANAITRSRETTPFCIGISGSWGSGKTSVVNMALETVREQAKPVTYVNWIQAWSTSSPDQVQVNLISEVLETVAADLPPELGATKEQLQAYKKEVIARTGLILQGAGIVSKALVPAPFSDLAKWIGDWLFDHNSRNEFPKELSSFRQDVIRGMNATKRHWIFVIDDLDRLTDHELLTVIRILRAVVDIPRVTYLLLFDRERVERALSSLNFTEPAYLEKLVNVLLEVPPIPDFLLQDLLAKELSTAYTIAGLIPDHEHVASRVAKAWHIGLADYIRTIRDLRRVVAVIEFRLRCASPYMLDPADLLVLETLRLFSPQTIALIIRYGGSLTNSNLIAGHFSASTEDSKDRDLVDLILYPLTEDSSVKSGTQLRHAHSISHLLRFLFPNRHPQSGVFKSNVALDDLLEAKRMAHPVYFPFFIDPTIEMMLLTPEYQQAFLETQSEQEIGKYVAKLRNTIELRYILTRLVQYTPADNLQRVVTLARSFCRGADYLDSFAPIFSLSEFESVFMDLERLLHKVSLDQIPSVIHAIIEPPPGFVMPIRLLLALDYKGSEGFVREETRVAWQQSDRYVSMPDYVAALDIESSSLSPTMIALPNLTLKHFCDHLTSSSRQSIVQLVINNRDLFVRMLKTFAQPEVPMAGDHAGIYRWAFSNESVQYMVGVFGHAELENAVDEYLENSDDRSSQDIVLALKRSLATYGKS